MEIYIYGAGQRGKMLYDRIKRSDAQICVKGFIDKYQKADNIVPIEVVGKEENIVISLANESLAYQVMEELEGKGYKKIFWCGLLDNPVYSPEEFLEKECLRMQKRSVPVLRQVEMHISDKCNLNCVGCAHYSPIFNEIGADYEQRMRDVKKFSELEVFVHRFYFLGGEPFLNPELGKYIVGVREILRETDLHIVTNGLLLLSVEDEVLETIADNNVTVSISEYEPTHKLTDKIEQRLQSFFIKYNIRRYDRKQVFNKPLSLTPDSVHPKLCISNGCVNIWNGKISRCPAVMYIDKFNEVFHTNLPNEGVINISDAPRGEELLKFLKLEIPLCEYCVENPIPWGRCGEECKLDEFATED